MTEAVIGKPAEAATTTTAAPTPTKPKTTNVCQEEALKVFPAQYWSEVMVTLQTENSLGNPKISRTNKGFYDKKGRWNPPTTDYGCFQINDHFQFGSKTSRWLSFNDIYDPNYNARVAYNIFKSHKNTWGSWYGPCTPGAEKLPKARCGH